MFRIIIFSLLFPFSVFSQTDSLHHGTFKLKKAEVPIDLCNMNFSISDKIVGSFDRSDSITDRNNIMMDGDTILLPKFPGGDQEMYKIIQEKKSKVLNRKARRRFSKLNKEITSSAFEDKIIGESKAGVSIRVSFTIDTDGSLEEIFDTPNDKYKIDAQRVVKYLFNTYKWSPAKVNGKAVKSIYCLTIYYGTRKKDLRR